MEGLDEMVRKLVGTEGILSDVIMGRVDIKKILDPLTVADLGRVEAEIANILAEVIFSQLYQCCYRDKLKYAKCHHYTANFELLQQYLIIKTLP